MVESRASSGHITCPRAPHVPAQGRGGCSVGTPASSSTRARACCREERAVLSPAASARRSGCGPLLGPPAGCGSVERRWVSLMRVGRARRVSRRTIWRALPGWEVGGGGWACHWSNEWARCREKHSTSAWTCPGSPAAGKRYVCRQCVRFTAVMYGPLVYVQGDDGREGAGRICPLAKLALENETRTTPYPRQSSANPSLIQ